MELTLNNLQKLIKIKNQTKPNQTFISLPQQKKKKNMQWKMNGDEANQFVVVED